jgi:CheY-like chemotaxis protein
MHGKILLVDDEKAVLDVTRMILEHFGYTVVPAQSGTEAIDLFSREPAQIDVVVLDLTMPNVGGAEVFQRIRALRADVPILFSSGYTSNSIPAELAGQPSTEFLQKPYQASALVGKIQVLIAAKS